MVRGEWSSLVRRSDDDECIDAPVGCPRIEPPEPPEPLSPPPPPEQVAAVILPPLPGVPPAPPPPMQVQAAEFSTGRRRRFTILPEVGVAPLLAGMALYLVAGFLLSRGTAGSDGELVHVGLVWAAGGCILADLVLFNVFRRRFDPTGMPRGQRVGRLVAGWVFLAIWLLGAGLGVRDAWLMTRESAESSMMTEEMTVFAHEGWAEALVGLLPDLESTFLLDFDEVVPYRVDPDRIDEVVSQRWPISWLETQLAELRALGLADGDDSPDDLKALLGAEPGVVTAVYDPVGREIVGSGFGDREGDRALALVHALLDQHGLLDDGASLLDDLPARQRTILTQLTFAVIDPSMSPDGWAPVDWIDSTVAGDPISSRSGEAGRPLAGLTDVWTTGLLLATDATGVLSFETQSQVELLDGLRTPVVPVEPALGPGETPVADTHVVDVGPITWAVALAGRVDPRGASKAALGWESGRAMLVERDGVRCVRSTNSFVTEADAAEFAFVAALWANAVGPAAQVAQPLPDMVEVVACDPGMATPPDESRSEVVPALMVTRAAVRQVPGGWSNPQVHCITERMTALISDELDDTANGSIVGLEQAIAACPPA